MKNDKVFVRRLLKQKKIAIHESKINPLDIIETSVICLDKTKEIKTYVEELNRNISKHFDLKNFKKFSITAQEEITKVIAPGIVGFNSVKQAVALQLFAREHIHILLLGDPGTGKTKILESACELQSISSMGLGSGTSGAGLAVTVKGKEIMKGLLPMADQGLCAIDELNLMKDDSRASLYNAMESGFVSYDKGGHHYRFDARISVLATANPKKDKFSGTTIQALKKQLPFDSALLSRFYLSFLIRKHSVEQFEEISKKIISGTKKVSPNAIAFVKRYINEANKIDSVSLPKHFEREITKFVSAIKSKEKDLLTEISPRLIVGFVKLAKASARCSLRKIVLAEDVELAKQIITESYKIPGINK